MASASNVGNAFTFSQAGHINAIAMKTAALLMTVILTSTGSGHAQQLPGENFPDANTVGLWHMNDSSGSTVVDSGDSSHTATATGTTIVAGRFGNARSFTNQPSYIDLGPQLFGGAPMYFTFEGWIKINAWATDQGTIFYDGADAELEIGTAPDSSLYYSVHTSTGWFEIKKRGLLTGRWYHVCATLDNFVQVQTLYVNGVLEAQTVITGQLVRVGASYRPTIGSYTAGSYFYGFLGVIDEVRISNKVRVPQEFDLQLPPINFTGHQSGFSLNLSWSNGGGRARLLRYRVYRGMDSTDMALHDSTGSTSYADLSLTDGLTYFYRISALDSTGFEGETSAARAITFNAPPSQVHLVYPVNGSTVGAQVAPFVWHRAVGQVDRYWFELATDSMFTSRAIDSTLTDTSTVVQNLSNGQFWWRVKARSLAGWGEFSQTARFKTVIVSVNTPADLPSHYGLSQNYPNPFNPFTTIRYELPKRTHANLTVFNALGQCIAVLVNEDREPGFYEVRFDGSNLASGVYFYRLRAGDFEFTKSLDLVR